MDDWSGIRDKANKRAIVGEKSLMRLQKFIDLHKPAKSQSVHADINGNFLLSVNDVFVHGRFDLQIQSIVRKKQIFMDPQ